MDAVLIVLLVVAFVLSVIVGQRDRKRIRREWEEVERREARRKLL